MLMVLLTVRLVVQEVKMYCFYNEVKLSQADKVLLRDNFEQVQQTLTDSLGAH